MTHDDSHWEIPSSIDLEGFLAKYPPDFTYKIDHFYFIVEYLAKGMEQQDVDASEGFVNTSSVKLQSRIKNYKKYLDHLLKHKFIHTDMQYIPGEKSTGYLLAGANKNDLNIKKIPIKDAVARKNRKNQNKIAQAKIEETRTNYNYLTKWFNSNLQIDYKSAEKKINELFPPQTGFIRGKQIGKPSRFTKKIKAIYSLNRLHEGNFYYSVDDNIGRFHSNLTNIKKELRNYITYNGQKLVNIDIKNSQPLFSILLFNENFYQKQRFNLNIYNIPNIQLYININKLQYNSTTTIIMLGKTLQKTDYKNYEEYIKMVKSGDFYKKLHNKLYPKTEFDKGKLKVMIFMVFFSKNRFIGQPEAKPKRDFKKTFPEIYKIFKLIKRNNHRALSYILQRIESEIIIQRASKRISKERPDLPIFTIHDSIATIQGEEKYVAKVIEQEVFSYSGLKVKLGYEYWDPNS